MPDPNEKRWKWNFRYEPHAWALPLMFVRGNDKEFRVWVLRIGPFAWMWWKGF